MSSSSVQSHYRYGGAKAKFQTQSRERREVGAPRTHVSDAVAQLWRRSAIPLDRANWRPDRQAGQARRLLSVPGGGGQMDRILASWKTPLVLFLGGLLMWFVSLSVEMRSRAGAAEQHGAAVSQPLPEAPPAPQAPPQSNEIQDYPQLD